MRKITLLLTMLTISLMGMAAGKQTQTLRARQVLDETAAKLQSSGGISMDFTIINYTDKKQQGSTSGSIDILERKFHFTTPDMLSWYDGQNQWSMIPGDTEANLTSPTAEEQQTMNPYAFLSIYKSGYSFKFTKTTLSNGATGWKILLKAKNKKQKISEMLLEIDTDYTPVRVTMREGKSNFVRINVTKFQANQKFADSHFTFPTAQYPNVEIVDLR